MTQAEFNSYWKTFFYTSSVGDPGSVYVGEGSASFIIGDQKYVGISQSVSPGNYLLSLSISGSLTNTRHFVAYSGTDKLCFFTSPGTYSIPVSITNGDIKLIYSSSVGTDINNLGILYSIKLEAPQTSYVETVYTVSGTVSRPHTDGKEKYMGDLKGTKLQVTNGTLSSNPFLASNYTITSSNPNFNFTNIAFYKTYDGSIPTTVTRYTYDTRLVQYPITIVSIFNPTNFALYYKIDTSLPNYNTAGTYSTTSPTGNSFTLLSSGTSITLSPGTYLSFGCSSSLSPASYQIIDNVSLYNSTNLINTIDTIPVSITSLDITPL